METLEIFVTIRADQTLLALASRLIDIGQQIIEKENQIMATLQQDVDAIAAETTAVGSLTTFIQGLEAQIAAMPGLSSDQQAQIDSIFDGVTKNAAAINAAMAINVPPSPPPTVVPPVTP
jgi:transposase